MVHFVTSFKPCVNGYERLSVTLWIPVCIYLYIFTYFLSTCTQPTYLHFPPFVYSLAHHYIHQPLYNNFIIYIPYSSPFILPYSPLVALLYITHYLPYLWYLIFLSYIPPARSLFLFLTIYHTALLLYLDGENGYQ